ncbi:MAG: hypothetical protein HKN32_03215 [Flavobacteriales bacterium]|nr:hypothetical protein [Flavobacteriales bacterium]
MSKIVIVSYNNLGLDFWKNHLSLGSLDELLHFHSGNACIQANPAQTDIVIVDDYFGKPKPGDLGSAEAIRLIANMHPQAKCFHVSPEYCSVDPAGRPMNYRCSNFNGDVISEINSILIPTPLAAS